MMTEKEVTSLVLEKEQHRQLKSESAATGESMSSFVRQAVNAALAKRRNLRFEVEAKIESLKQPIRNKVRALGFPNDFNYEILIDSNVYLLESNIDPAAAEWVVEAVCADCASEKSYIKVDLAGRAQEILDGLKEIHFESTLKDTMERLRFDWLYSSTHKHKRVKPDRNVRGGLLAIQSNPRIRLEIKPEIRGPLAQEIVDAWRQIQKLQAELSRMDKPGERLDVIEQEVA